jgi:hypothetical protein
MAGWLARRGAKPEPERIQLELSGPRLARSLAKLAAGCEAHGGIERYVEAVKLKGVLFREALGEHGELTAALDPETFKGLCPFMATVRRRVAPWLAQPAFDLLKQALVDVVAAVGETASADQRLAAFCARVGDGEQHRWVRDLGAEVLHNLAPERFPLMTRWVWDAAANTGVIREIWFAEDVDHQQIDVPDRYLTFLTLREELSQFLSQNGFYRDMIHYVDLLCAQIYAEYICEQGGSYLRTDFSAEDDPLQFTRRLLGLDGIKAGSGRTRLKTIDGEAFTLAERPDLRLLD